MSRHTTEPRQLAAPGRLYVLIMSSPRNERNFEEFRMVAHGDTEIPARFCRATDDWEHHWYRKEEAEKVADFVKEHGYSEVWVVIHKDLPEFVEQAVDFMHALAELLPERIAVTGLTYPHSTATTRDALEHERHAALSALCDHSLDRVTLKEYGGDVK